MSDTNNANIDTLAFRSEIDDKLLKSVAAEPATANTKEIYKAISVIARDQLAARWVKTQVADRKKKTRRIYYMSMEFLIGRSLNNALSALDMHSTAEAAFSEAGGPSRPTSWKVRAGCSARQRRPRPTGSLLPRLDGHAGTTVLGLRRRHEYGMFAQSIINGGQVEHPDSWLSTERRGSFRAPAHTSPCALAAPPNTTANGQNGMPPRPWRRAPSITSFPATAQIASKTLRLWKAGAPAQIDLNAFNGDYAPAPPNSRTGSRTFPGCSTRMTVRQRVANCACGRSIFSLPLHRRTSCSITLKSTARCTIWPTRSPFTSTTHTRQSVWPS